MESILGADMVKSLTAWSVRFGGESNWLTILACRAIFLSLVIAGPSHARIAPKTFKVGDICDISKNFRGGFELFQLVPGFALYRGVSNMTIAVEVKEGMEYRRFSLLSNQYQCLEYRGTQPFDREDGFQTELEVWKIAPGRLCAAQAAAVDKRKKEVDRAREDVRKRPTDSNAWAAMGRAFKESGESAKADFAYAMCNRLQPTNKAMAAYIAKVSPSYDNGQFGIVFAEDSLRREFSLDCRNWRFDRRSPIPVFVAIGPGGAPDTTDFCTENLKWNRPL